MMRQYYESMLTPDSDDLDRHGIDREMEDYNPFGDEDNSSDWEDMGPVPDPSDDEMTNYNLFGGPGPRGGWSFFPPKQPDVVTVPCYLPQKC